ncbi:MAG: trypsin-like peptidase domain-containing protein [Candidatus Moranbacteria bacterium]|nr:trypsin-like peptidase domain-containing protein [Candidatus Moranbacteria bacterium]
MEIIDEPIRDEAKSDAYQPAPKKRTGLLIGMFFLIVGTIFISSVLGAAFGFLAGNVSKGFLPDRLTGFLGISNSIENPEIIKQRIVEEDSAVIDVVEKKSPAVVSIVISKDVSQIQGSLPFDLRNFFGQGTDQFGSSNSGTDGEQKKKVGGGSGFLVTADGMVVTNKHVVSDETAEYTVMTNDNKEHAAKILAVDPVNDIAVIKIEGQDYPTLDLGDSDSLKIGQSVVAIGNSLGEFSNTVSKGIVSGLGRSLTASGGRGQTEKLSDIIQTDAAINPGNSGGPLLNIDGEVVGINVAMAQGAQNIGFAIPANQIKRVVEQVKTTGKITAPYLGVRYVPIDDEIKKAFNFSYSYGVLVVRGDRVTDFAVIPGSPADKAGIVENDVILEIDGEKIDEKNSLSGLVAKHNVGDSVILKIWHKGELRDVSLLLVERK